MSRNSQRANAAPKRMIPQEDLTDAEVAAIHKRIDAEVAKQGLPSDDDLMASMERLNKPVGYSRV